METNGEVLEDIPVVTQNQKKNLAQEQYQVIKQPGITQPVITQQVVTPPVINQSVSPVYQNPFAIPSQYPPKDYSYNFQQGYLNPGAFPNAYAYPPFFQPAPNIHTNLYPNPFAYQIQSSPYGYYGLGPQNGTQFHGFSSLWQSAQVPYEANDHPLKPQESDVKPLTSDIPHTKVEVKTLTEELLKSSNDIVYQLKDTFDTEALRRSLRKCKQFKPNLNDINWKFS